MTTNPLAIGEQVLLIRLKNKWIDQPEEVETGYLRAGFGWREDISNVQLMDAVRAWWRLSPAQIERRGITHVVAVVGGHSKALYRLEGFIGPRIDGRWAFRCTEVTDGALFDALVGNAGRHFSFRNGAANPVMYYPATGR